MNKNIIAEQATAVYLKDTLIGIFHFDLEEIENYVYNSYIFLGLEYDDVADLEFKTFWNVYYEDCLQMSYMVCFHNVNRNVLCNTLCMV